MLQVIIQVILSLSAVQAQYEQSCSDFYSQRNFKLTGHVLTKIDHSNSLTNCITKCSLKTTCHSVNYHHGDGVCELNDASHLNQPVSLVPGDGYQYLNYHHRPSTNCSKKYCSRITDSCEIESDGQHYRCISCRGIYNILNYGGKGRKET